MLQDTTLLQKVTRLQPLAPERLPAPSFFEAPTQAAEIIERLHRILQVEQQGSTRGSSL
jgi:hypothetical protein